MPRIDAEFGFKGGLGFLVFVLFPVEIAETEINIWFAGGGFGGGFKLRYGFDGSAQAVEGFSTEHVSGGGIGIALENLAELCERAVVLLGRQATLREDAVEFD